MHPRNKLRLLAGLTIDASLEKTPVIEAREVPNRKDVMPANASNLKRKQESVNKACQHLRNAVKALEAAPATDTSAEIPQMIKEIEDLCSELESMSSAIGEVKPTKENLKEQELPGGEAQPTTSQQFKDGDVVLYDDGIYVVVLSDAQADMVGIIPAGLANASADEKNRAVEMVKPDKLRKPTEEEMAVMKQSPEQRASIDDDMAAQFSMESVQIAESALHELWDMKRAKKAGERYKKKKKEEECEMTVSESTHNYAPGNQVSHKDTVSDPINVVGQGEKQWANSLDPKMVKNEYTSQLDNRGDQSMTDYEAKVKVPTALKKSLRDAIDAFHKDAENQGSGHTASENKQMFMDTADAFEQILDHLNAGTVQELKKAQLFATSLMGPMLHKLPDGVWDFIVNGGQKRSLKDYMIKVSK
jgi:hypothetical protein